MFYLTLFFVSVLPLINAQDEECLMPLDVMFLQDTTGSFYDDLPNVVAQIPRMVDQILDQHPDSWIGVAEFKDKPYFPLGELDDYCYKLNDGSLTSNMARFAEAYEKLWASGGADLPEAQFQALIDVSLDTNVGWRPLADTVVEPNAGEAGARLIIMSTDAPPHLPGDMQLVDTDLYPGVPQDLPDNTAEIVDGDPSYACKNQDYPSHIQVKDVLTAQEIYLVILTPDEPLSTNAWRWFIEDHLGYPADFVQIISDDSSDLMSGVLEAIKAVTAYVCPYSIEAPTSAESSVEATTTSASAATSTAQATTAPAEATSAAPTTVEATTVVTSAASSTVEATIPAAATSAAPTTTEATTSATPTTTEATTSAAPTTKEATTSEATTTMTTPPETTSDATTTMATPTAEMVTPAAATSSGATTPAAATSAAFSDAANSTASGSNCECPCPVDPCGCPCPAVVIKFAEAPSILNVTYTK